MTRLGVFGRAVAVTVTTGVALTLAGCGDQGASSAGSSGEDSSASKDSSVKVDDSAGGLSKDEILTVTTQAAVKAGSAHMTMKATQAGKQLTDMQGDVSYAGGSSVQAVTTAPDGSKTETRFVGGILYTQIPGMTPAGKFIAIDPKDESSPLAKTFAGLTEQMDPLASIKTLQSAVTSAERVGGGTVQGESVDHYKVVVDTAQMLAKMGAAGQQAQAQMPKTFTYDFWLDSDNLIRKMSFDLMGTSTDVELSDWGKPVEIKRPAAGDIVKTPAMPGA